ncbi:uncharacterized protein C7orf31-like [Pristis pectinata]|uniref:uncharacterized protein C7orf31-like n=1 Tax=Pristis pectinata TaxID=685728 RepID=UPI00223DD45B|nr:uncharacterized protein C7orf31-like [Pristis pectinata]
MDQKQIQLPFPAEHPFYSHVSKFAVFPNFISPDDPYTGVRAGRLLPINPDMPAKSYNVIVTQKTKERTISSNLDAESTLASLEDKRG